MKTVSKLILPAQERLVENDMTMQRIARSAQGGYGAPLPSYDAPFPAYDEPAPPPPPTLPSQFYRPWETQSWVNNGHQRSYGQHYHRLAVCSVLHVVPSVLCAMYSVYSVVCNV